MEARRVQRLRIRADGAGQARTAAVYLEDALRTASFPNLPRNGVIYIRRLDLGCIGPRLERGRLSRHIDQRLLALPAGAIRRGDAATDQVDAEAVWFSDPVAPLLACAERIVHRRPLRAWYWQRVLGRSAPTVTRPDLGMLMVRAERLPQPEPAVKALIRHLARHDGLLELLSAMPLEMLWRQVSWLYPQVVAAMPVGQADAGTDAPAAPLAVAPGGRGARPRLPMRWYPVLSAAARRWPGRTPQRTWLLLVACHLEGQSLRPEEWRARMAGFDAIKPAAEAASEQMSGADARPKTLPDAAQPAPEDRTIAGASTGGLGAAPLSPEAQPPAAPAGDPRPRSEPGSRPEVDPVWRAAPLWDGRASAAAGLLFMLPVWFRLGLSGSLERHDWLVRSAFPVLLLRRLGWWLRLPDDDPMLAWLPEVQVAPAREWAAPEAWRGTLAPWLRRFGTRAHPCGRITALSCLGDRLVLRLAAEGFQRPAECRDGAPWRADSLTPRLADSWLRLSALWLHRHGLGVRRLVMRPGMVAAGDTHLDVCFRLEQTDLAVRLSALDLDPGWVPALGRVIKYHYLGGEDDRA